MANGRAILFTTDKLGTVAPADPAAPENLVIIRDSAPNDSRVLLYWDEVTQDVLGNPITVDGYNVYGGATEDVTPGTGVHLGFTPTPDFIDPDGTTRDIYFYVVEAIVN